jgi:hypothetical protein
MRTTQVVITQCDKETTVTRKAVPASNPVPVPATLPDPAPSTAVSAMPEAPSGGSPDHAAVAAAPAAAPTAVAGSRARRDLRLWRTAVRSAAARTVQSVVRPRAEKVVAQVGAQAAQLGAQAAQLGAQAAQVGAQVGAMAPRATAGLDTLLDRLGLVRKARLEPSSTPVMTEVLPTASPASCAGASTAASAGASTAASAAASPAASAAGPT